jgi:hypothetical protein
VFKTYKIVFQSGVFWSVLMQWSEKSGSEFYYCTGVNHGMEWNGMEWSGMEWKLSLIIGCTCFEIIKYLFSVVEVCEL